MAQKVVLLLEDDESVQLVTSDFLSSEGYIVKTSKTIKKLWNGNKIWKDRFMFKNERFSRKLCYI